MDFDFDDAQRAIHEAVKQLLERHAGPERAVALATKAEYDFPLDAAIDEAGFGAVARGEETGPLEAARVVEAVAEAAGTVAIGAGALVAPGATRSELPGPIAIAEAGRAGPVRFAAHARTLIVSDGESGRVVALEPGEVEPVASNFGYPMGRLDPATRLRGDALPPGSGERLRSWWRVALAAEALGTMNAALQFTLGYVKERRQFGRSIASFQAVQHRLSECAVCVEGSRWLTYQAAWQGAPAEAAAIAAAHAMAAANRVFGETHQLSGAIGYTREHALHVWSMRLQALRLELGGVAGHRRAAARARWTPSP